MKIIWTFELGLNDKQHELFRDLGSLGSGSIQMKSLTRMHINWHAKFNFNKIPVVLIFCVSPDFLGSTQTWSINMASHIWTYKKKTWIRNFNYLSIYPNNAPSAPVCSDGEDSSRDCGMPEGEERTVLEAGSTLNVTWSLGYAHKGGYK